MEEQQSMMSSHVNYIGDVESEMTYKNGKAFS